MNGVLIIDKPAGLTSHDVVGCVRRILGQRSVGHLGTLDPMATGVLPLVIGSFTRLAQFYVSSEKSYEGSIRLGFSTDTYDAEGEPTSTPKQVLADPPLLEVITAKFRGIIEQTPPPFSAKKIKGVPAYKLARKQQEVALKPVKVEIKEFEILHAENDRVKFHARVSSGTYIRSVAHEIGQELGCGAHLESLRRTAVSEFSLEDAHTLDEISAAAGKSDQARDVDQTCPESGKNADILQQYFIHPRKVLPHFPSLTADEFSAARVRTGQTVNLPDFSGARQIKVFIGQSELIAIATRVAGTLFHPKIVLSSS